MKTRLPLARRSGSSLSEVAKILYLMSNLNDSIFGEVKANYMNLSTRALYPRNYEDLKQRMIAEYSQISTRKPQLVFKIIRGEDGKHHGEASFKAEEKGCHICGGGHFWKSCRFYNDKNTLELNQRWFKKKHKDDSTDDHKATEGGPRGGASSAGAGGATVKKGAANKAPRSSGSTPQSEEKSEQAKVARNVRLLRRYGNLSPLL